MDPALQLRLAIEGGDMGEAMSLLDEHPELIQSRSGEDATPLHIAALYDQTDIAEQLLARGADIDARTTWNGTPLECALIGGHEQTAAVLAAQGITPHTLRTLAGVGAMDEVEDCFDEVGRLKPGLGSTRSIATREHGWSFKPPPSDPQTILNDALEYAARNGRLDAAKLLIRRGAAVNGRGFFGATPLHWAVANGKVAMVELLLDHGADVNARDEKHRSTTLSWAREFGRDAVADLLERWGAE